MSTNPPENDSPATNPYTKPEAHRRKTAIPVPSLDEISYGTRKAVKITGDIIGYVRSKIGRRTGIILAIIATAVAGLGVAWEFKGKEIYEEHEREKQEEAAKEQKKLEPKKEIKIEANLKMNAEGMISVEAISGQNIIDNCGTPHKTTDQEFPLSSLPHASLNRVNLSPTFTFTDHDGNILEYASEEILVSEEDLQNGTVTEITAHLNQ